jgi:hypothetical protein
MFKEQLKNGDIHMRSTNDRERYIIEIPKKPVLFFSHLFFSSFRVTPGSTSSGTTPDKIDH